MRSALCSFHQSPFTSSLLGPDISSTPCSQTPSTYFYAIYSMHLIESNCSFLMPKKCAGDMYNYSPVSFLHVSASFAPSSGSYTPRYKADQNIIGYKSNSYCITVFLQILARFSTLVQNGPWTHTASYTMGTASFPGVKRPERGVNRPPTFSAEVKERRQLYLYSASVL
jgi:hypothetical protein